MRQSIDLETTFLELIQSISLLLLFSMALLLVNSSRRIKLTIITLVASGLFQALFGSLMTLSGIEYTFFLEKESYIGVATGTFINRNHLAGYLVICLSLGLGMMIASLKGSASSLKEFSRNFLSAILSQKAPLRISLVIMVAALVMTHSRMGNTAFFASMGIIGTLTILLKKRSAGSTILLLVSLLVIDIAVVGSFFGVDKVINRLEQTSIDKETRDEVNLYSIKIIEDNLLQGTGAGTFYTSFPQVREREVGFLFYDHAHNDYFEFLTERGVIGSAPLLLAVILTFIMSLYALWKRRNPLMRGCAFACSMSMLAMAIHAS
ncbi:O-antigen ligase, partial [Moritella sp.]|uniref:O-antigen ligase family protein n=1 Tax=Moritella sp. TaxID=78556 RepID=UPI0025FA113E